MGGHDEHLTGDQAQRAGALVGIHAALRTIFTGPRCYDWIQKPNEDPLFAGQSALAFMIGGGLPAIQSVRDLLQSEAG